MLSEEQLIDIVGVDLLFLREEWDASIDDHSLRRSSTVLRRLLVENELQRAWKKAGLPNEPRIRASTLTPLLTAVPLPRIRFATAGGATFKGVQIRGLMAVNYAMTESEIRPSTPRVCRRKSSGYAVLSRRPVWSSKEP